MPLLKITNNAHPFLLEVGNRHVPSTHPPGSIPLRPYPSLCIKYKLSLGWQSVVVTKPPGWHWYESVQHPLCWFQFRVFLLQTDCWEHLSGCTLSSLLLSIENSWYLGISEEHFIITVFHLFLLLLDFIVTINYFWHTGYCHRKKM